MITRPYQNDQLSLLGMGNMRLPLQSQNGLIDRVKAAEMIDYGYQHGINYFDTAYVYHSGESESAVGEIMQRYPRDSFRLATKFLYAANPDYRAVFAQQLARLRTDYIDFYLIHAINDQSAAEYVQSGCIEYFLEQQKQGRIRHLGFSAHCSLSTLKTFAAHHAWDFAQLQLNYLDWDGIGMKQQYEALTAMGIPVGCNGAPAWRAAGGTVAHHGENADRRAAGLEHPLLGVSLADAPAQRDGDFKRHEHAGTDAGQRAHL